MSLQLRYERGKVMLYLVEAHASMERGNKIDAEQGPGPIFAKVAEHRNDALNRLIAGAWTPNHLHSWNEVRRVEPVRAECSILPVYMSHDLSDWQSGGVGAKDGRRLTKGVELAEERLLEGEVFARCLEDEVCSSDGGIECADALDASSHDLRRVSPLPLARDHLSPFKSGGEG